MPGAAGYFVEAYLIAADSYVMECASHLEHLGIDLDLSPQVRLGDL